MPEKIKTIILCVLATGIGVSGWMFYNNYQEGQEAIRMMNQLQSKQDNLKLQTKSHVSKQLEDENNGKVNFDIFGKKEKSKESSKPNAKNSKQEKGNGNGQEESKNKNQNSTNNNSMLDMQNQMNNISMEMNNQASMEEFNKQAKQMQEEYQKAVEEMDKNFKNGNINMEMPNMNQNLSMSQRNDYELPEDGSIQLNQTDYNTMNNLNTQGQSLSNQTDNISEINYNSTSEPIVEENIDVTSILGN